MGQVDELILSRYLDSDVGVDEATRITGVIVSDKEARDRLIELVTSKVLVGSLGRQKEQEVVPERLRQALAGPRHRRVSSWAGGSLYYLQTAILVLLMVGTFILGRESISKPAIETIFFPSMSIPLEQNISQVLEYQKSGVQNEWVSLPDGISARITPVRSFRDAQGGFYRMYMIDFRQKESTRQFWAIANRSGKEMWQTKGVFTQPVHGSI